MDVSIYQLQYLEYGYWSFFKPCDLVLFTSQLSALGRRVVIGFDRVLSEYSLHCDSAVLVIDRSVQSVFVRLSTADNAHALLDNSSLLR